MPATSFADPAVDEFRREVTAWLTTAIPAEWRERRDHLPMDEEIEIRRAWDRQLFDAGYAGLSSPEQFGGRGLGVIEDFTFNDIAARMDAPEGLGRVGRLLAGPAIMHHGTAEMCARFLPAISQGRGAVVPGVLRAGRRLGPRLATHPRGPRRRRVPHPGAEGVDHLRQLLRLVPAAGPHRRPRLAPAVACR